MNNETLPLVSVLMTAYNREPFIAEAIESVLASTYQPIELIIVDDHSTDRTVAIAKEYEARHSFIKVYVNENNLGQFPNRNKAIGYASGTFLVHVDSDDMVYPDGIEKLVQVMQAHPESAFGMYTTLYNEVTVLPPEVSIKNHFFKKAFLMHGPGGTILRRDFFNSIGGYPIEYGIPGDVYFNLKACCYTSVTLIPFKFMHYRLHEGQELNNSYNYLYNNYLYMHDALEKLPLGITDAEKKWLSKKMKRRFVVNISKYFLKTFDLKKTRNAIWLSRFSFSDAMTGIFQR
ncbi:MAG: glycosyltransferase family A protein [Ferruginibacter sp.]